MAGGFGVHAQDIVGQVGEVWGDAEIVADAGEDGWDIGALGAECVVEAFVDVSLQLSPVRVMLYGVVQGALDGGASRVERATRGAGGGEAGDQAGFECDGLADGARGAGEGEDGVAAAWLGGGGRGRGLEGGRLGRGGFGHGPFGRGRFRYFADAGRWFG